MAKRDLPSYRIVKARLQDLPHIPGIELAAAKLLEGHVPDDVLHEITPQEVLSVAQKEGRLWVALLIDTPVGFAHVERVETESAHLEELDVHPDHGRRGLGTRLIAQVRNWAIEHAFKQITLTTFRDVPWNMPFYLKMGFEEILPGSITPAVRSILINEEARGLDPARRLAMTWRI